jgi:hypothetical protein
MAKFNIGTLILDALIILIFGGVLSMFLGGLIASAGASSEIMAGFVSLVLSILTIWLLKQAKLNSFLNIIGLFGVALGLSQIIGALFPTAGQFMLGLGGNLTLAGLVSLLFYASMADYIGDKIGL